jgi:hypothetical protein
MNGRTNELVRDEIWTHRILYAVAKTANFRAAGTDSQLVDSSHLNRQTRLVEWSELHSLLEFWNRSAPRTMQPMAFIEASKTHLPSTFPEVWLIKRPAVIACLLYHTAFILLAQLHPQVRSQKASHDEMQALAHEHAVLVCGIVAHSQDRGIASVAVRALSIAGEVLTDPAQQQEILTVLERIAQNTGWAVHRPLEELPKKWGWPVAASEQQSRSRGHSNPQVHLPGLISASGQPPVLPWGPAKRTAGPRSRATRAQQQQQHSSPTQQTGSSPLLPYTYPGVVGLPSGGPLAGSVAMAQRGSTGSAAGQGVYY